MKQADTQKHARPRKAAPAEIVALRVCLAQKELSMADLARLAGMKPGALHTAITAGVPGKRTRAKLEAALERPIWTPLAEFQRRCVRAKLFGFVAEGATLNQLHMFGQKLGVPGITTHRRNADCIVVIETFLRSQQTKKTT